MTGQITNLGLASVIVGVGAFAAGLWSHSLADMVIGGLFVTIPFAFQQYNRWEYSRLTNFEENDG